MLGKDGVLVKTFEKKTGLLLKMNGLAELIFYQILSTNSLKKCMKISLENLYVDIKTQRV